MARYLALICVKQTRLENPHRGLSTITWVGDYSDVVVDADGRRLPRREISRFSWASKAGHHAVASNGCDAQLAKPSRC